MHKNNGILLVVEGVDGAGKSTLVRNLANQLAHKNREILITKEPGGSELGKYLRELVQTQPVPITPMAEYLLFAADRAQHIAQVIKPALARGAIIISDRMADSSLAYQGYGRGLDRDYIQKINAWIMQGIIPDLVFYLKLSPQQAAQRIKKRLSLTAFEKEQEIFTERLLQGFDSIFSSRPNVVTIDAMLPENDVTLHAYKAIEQWQKLL